MENTVNGSDIWYARNQPYGYWRVGNPIVKMVVVFLLLFGVLVKSPSIIIQSSILIYIMLWLPFKPKNKLVLVLINLGIGGFIVGLFYPNVILNYNILDIKFEIQHVASIKILHVVSIFLLVISLLFMTKAVTSRDYAWFISLLPNKFKKSSSGYTYSYAYALIRVPLIISEANVSLLSRGFNLPFALRLKVDRIESSGLWLICIFRELRDMAVTIEHLIISKIKPENRITPVAKHFSLTDLSISGIIIFSIIGPRVLEYIKTLI
ncbi:MAG: hypothetical protein ACOCQD_02455 [archaeon]